MAFAEKAMKRTSIHTSEHLALVGLLRDIRLEAGLSQAEAAARVKRPQTYISAIEVGGRGPDLLHVRKLAEVYGLTFVEFAERLEERIKDQPYQAPRRKRQSSKVGSR